MTNIRTTTTTAMTGPFLDFLGGAEGAAVGVTG